MECQDVKKQLSKWLDGEIKTPETNLIKTHLDRCVFCTREAETLLDVQELLRLKSNAIELSPSFEEKFWIKLSEHHQSNRFLVWLRELDWSLPMPSAEQAFAVMVLVFIMGSTGGVVLAMNEGSSAKIQGVASQYLEKADLLSQSPLDALK